jgi:hypothetical protein
LNPEQIAKLTPENRVRYELLIRQQQAAQQAAQQTTQPSLQASLEEVNRLRQLQAEANQAVQQEQAKEIPMTPEERSQTVQKIQDSLKIIRNLSKVISRWYHVHKDDNRTKLFFRAVSQSSADEVTIC